MWECGNFGLDREVIVINDEGVKRLMCAVVLQTVRDYQAALRHYNISKHKDREIEYMKVIRECELFFQENIGAYCSIDGEKIITKLRADVAKTLNKRGIIMEVPENDD
ncbi:MULTISPECIES: hypothetical protein [Blautia]|uniref:hypothetical protein n=1 Tax=Blautia TaxID=572511 RepID=UPI000BA4A79E|nr:MULTISPECIES: hypothetical protein [Blautia]